MAIKYFVHAGFQIRTIDVAPSVLGLGGTDNIPVAVMDDVAFALLDTGAFTPILGSDLAVALNTLTGYWTGRQGGITKVRQDVLVARAPLIEPNPSDADDTRGSPTTYSIHKESNQWVLPPGLDQIIPIPNAANNPVGGQRVNLIQTLIFDFTNLQRFDTAPEAWSAYNNYFLTLGLEDEITAARATYFVNPPEESMTTSGS